MNKLINFLWAATPGSIGTSIYRENNQDNKEKLIEKIDNEDRTQFNKNEISEYEDGKIAGLIFGTTFEVVFTASTIGVMLANSRLGWEDLAIGALYTIVHVSTYKRLNKRNLEKDNEIDQRFSEAYPSQYRQNFHH